MTVSTDAKRDARKLVKTATPAIYRRQNADGTLGQYVVIYRAGGKQRREYADTLDEARRLKRGRESDRDRGAWQEPSKETLRAFLTAWVDRYQGNGRRGFREGTRAEYRRLLDAYAHRYFNDRLRLVDVTPHHLAQFVGWLADPVAQARNAHRSAVEQAKADGKPTPNAPAAGARRELADSTIANAVMPVRAALATAQREGLIRHNPALGLALPRRERIEEDEDEHVKALSRDQLAALLSQVHSRHRLLLRLMASTGLRVSEVIALQRRHLRLDGDRPHLLVRQALVRGRTHPPKSRHGRRTVPIPASLVHPLRDHLAAATDAPEDALVFPSQTGTSLDPDNMRARILKPVLEEIGAPWAGFHSLRHTYASLQLAAGTNVLQLSRALGHHSPAFTLEVYCHLLDDDMAPALDLDEALRVNTPHGTETHDIDAELAAMTA